MFKNQSHKGTAAIRAVWHEGTNVKPKVRGRRSRIIHIAFEPLALACRSSACLPPPPAACGLLVLVLSSGHVDEAVGIIAGRAAHRIAGAPADVGQCTY